MGLLSRAPARSVLLPGGCVGVCGKLCKVGIYEGTLGGVNGEGRPEGGSYAFVEAQNEAPVRVSHPLVG